MYAALDRARRDETSAIAVLHAAQDAGVTFLDTADAYSWSDEERGHNERLVARAVSTWPGDRSAVIVATKGGMTRPGGPVNLHAAIYPARAVTVALVFIAGCGTTRAPCGANKNAIVVSRESLRLIESRGGGR